MCSCPIDQHLTHDKICNICISINTGEPFIVQCQAVILYSSDSGLDGCYQLCTLKINKSESFRMVMNYSYNSYYEFKYLNTLCIE